MKKTACFFALVLLPFALALDDPKVDKEGKAWLDRYTDPAEMNVTGTWDSSDWGQYEFFQKEGSREITGSGEWFVNGVVSGKKAYLLFSWEGEVEYSAEMTAEGEDKLVGSYSRGLMSGSSKPKPILFKKQ